MITLRVDTENDTEMLVDIDMVIRDGCNLYGSRAGMSDKILICACDSINDAKALVHQLADHSQNPVRMIVDDV